MFPCLQFTLRNIFPEIIQIFRAVQIAVFHDIPRKILIRQKHGTKLLFKSITRIIADKPVYIFSDLLIYGNFPCLLKGTDKGCIDLQEKLHTDHHVLLLLFISKNDQTSEFRIQKGKQLSVVFPKPGNTISRICIAFVIIFRQDIPIKLMVLFLQFLKRGQIQLSICHIAVSVRHEDQKICHGMKILPEVFGHYRTFFCSLFHIQIT